MERPGISIREGGEGMVTWCGTLWYVWRAGRVRVDPGSERCGDWGGLVRQVVNAVRFE